MTLRLPVLFGWASAGLIGGVNVIALSEAPADAGVRAMVLLAALVAVGFAVQSAGWDPSALSFAVLLSSLPIVGMVGGGAPTWLVAVPAALLLVAGELNALSWELRDRGEVSVMLERRLLAIVRLGGLGLAAGVGVAAVSAVPMAGGLFGLLVGAGGLVLLGRVMFPGGRNSSSKQE
jgi:hypothetical protein